jgi:hypothetical protein
MGKIAHEKVPLTRRPWLTPRAPPSRRDAPSLPGGPGEAEAIARLEAPLRKMRERQAALLESIRQRR